MVTESSSDEARHPIRVVADRTGISTHVLRAWERRYGVVSPKRTDGGQRYYSDADIHRLSLLLKASLSGRSVGQLASLPTEELALIVAEDAALALARPTESGSHRALALSSVRDMQPDRLQAVLKRALLSLGTSTFLDDLLTPLLIEIGEEWHAGRLDIAHEHAASAAIEQLLGALVRELNVLTDAPRVLIATPAGQRHSHGALMAAAAAAHDGWHVVWLGADLPAAQIAAAARSHGAIVVGLSVTTTEEPDRLESELTLLRQSLDAITPMYVGGAAGQSIGHVPGVSIARDLTHWRNALRTHVPASSVRSA